MAPAFFILTGAKGGAGTSTLCVELGRAMREQTGVTLVDADFSGRRSLGILTDGVRQLDAARARGAGHIAQARINGLSVVELAESYESSFTVTLREVESAAASLTAPGVVLTDVPLPFSANVRPFIVRATRFVVVTEPTRLGVMAARTLAGQLLHFGIPMARIVIVTTPRSDGVTATRSEIERTTGIPVLADIPQPSDDNFPRALAQLRRELLGIPAEPMLEQLLAFDADRVRDRRAETRETNGACAPTLLSADSGPAATPHAFDGSAEDIAHIKQEIVNEALGLGPIEEFLHRPDVTEVMVNGPNDIYVEIGGVIQKTAKHFPSEAQLRLVIERIIAPLGRRIDDSVPIVEARLPDGSRVNAIIEPLSLNGPTLTIRRFRDRRLTAEDLLENGSIAPEVLDFLRACVQARLNMLISGGTGSGKTTFLNVLSSYVPQRERIITIEDAAELRLSQPHVVRLESRPPNLEGKGRIPIRELVRNALRMRPDRIVVGECRGPEALEMLEAMNTGHDGSLSTIHASGTREALSRMETMVMMAGLDLPIRAIREQMSSAIDIVVQTGRLRDGSRKVTAVSEIAGMEGDTVRMQEIVRFTQLGTDEHNHAIGEYHYAGVQPAALRRFDEYGIAYDRRTLSTLGLGTEFA